MFLGESLDLNCIDVDTDERLNPTLPGGGMFGINTSRVVDSTMFDGVYECRLSSGLDGDVCAQTATELVVRVFGESVVLLL